MIVWLNGPFGVGKTTVGRYLVEEWNDAILFDPELIGMIVRATVPKEASVDFQTLRVWRESVLHFAQSFDRTYPGPIIVPMSVLDPSVHDEVIGGLRRAGVEVLQFTLMASETTLLDRITNSEERGSSEWRLDHVDAALEALS